MPGPLANVRVVDLTAVLMGPFATQMLAEFGADVIKIEPPTGDVVRQIGPARNPGMGPIYLNANRGKRSLAVDLKDPDGRAAVLALIKDADVVVYNMRPQAMARLGLTYEDVAAVNPGVVYLGVFGYGQDGPYAARPAYDDLIQGAALLPALFLASGASVPRYVPAAITDRIVAYAAVNAVLAALVHRAATGVGQKIEIPMFETMVAFVLGDHLAGLTFDPPEGPAGYARLLSADRRPYRTSDGYICALVYTDKHWRGFLAAIGRAEVMASDPRFASLEARSRNIDAIYAELGAIFETRTTAEWAEILERADVPYTPMHTLETIFEDPHLRATDFFTAEEHPSEGRLKKMRTGGSWSATPVGVDRHAPRLGEQSREILAEAGYAPEAIDALIAAGVVRAAAPIPDRAETAS
mgnify:CR=1 FL=1